MAAFVLESTNDEIFMEMQTAQSVQYISVQVSMQIMITIIHFFAFEMILVVKRHEARTEPKIKEMQRKFRVKRNVLCLLQLIIFGIYIYFVRYPLFQDKEFDIISPVFIIMFILRLCRLSMEIFIIALVWHFFRFFVKIKR